MNNIFRLYFYFSQTDTVLHFRKIVVPAKLAQNFPRGICYVNILTLEWVPVGILYY